MSGILPGPVIRAIVRLSVRPVLGPRVPVRLQRRLLHVLSRFPLLPRDTQLASVDLGNRPAERVSESSADDTRAVLYLHGGGYTIGSPAGHRALAGHLAASAGAPVYVLDYRLAPEHPYPAAVDDAAAAYRALLEAGIDPQRLTVAGDSAGLTGLPPMLVHSADDEILLADIERLVEQAGAAGVSVVHRRLERMWHVAHLHAGLVTDSTAAVREIGAFLRNSFDHDSRMGNPHVN